MVPLVLQTLKERAGRQGQAVRADLVANITVGEKDGNHLESLPGGQRHCPIKVRTGGRATYLLDSSGTQDPL